jgi:hypothetical protein
VAMLAHLQKCRMSRIPPQQDKGQAASSGQPPVTPAVARLPGAAAVRSFIHGNYAPPKYTLTTRPPPHGMPAWGLVTFDDLKNPTHNRCCAHPLMCPVIMALHWSPHGTWRGFRRSRLTEGEMREAVTFVNTEKRNVSRFKRMLKNNPADHRAKSLLAKYHEEMKRRCVLAKKVLRDELGDHPCEVNAAVAPSPATTTIAGPQGSRTPAQGLRRALVPQGDLSD